MNDILVIGKIVGAHGVHGEIKIVPITDDPGRFVKLREAILLTADEKPVRNIVLRSCRSLGNNVAVIEEGIDDRDLASSLNGIYIAIHRSEAAELLPGCYFIADLNGCRIIDDLIGVLGTVVDVLEQPGADVFVIKRDGKNDLLVPFLRSVVYRVDIDSSEIYVRLPDGLFEIYES